MSKGKHSNPELRPRVTTPQHGIDLLCCWTARRRRRRAPPAVSHATSARSVLWRWQVSARRRRRRRGLPWRCPIPPNRRARVQRRNQPAHNRIRHQTRTLQCDVRGRPGCGAQHREGSRLHDPTAAGDHRRIRRGGNSGLVTSTVTWSGPSGSAHGPHPSRRMPRRPRPAAVPRSTRGPPTGPRSASSPRRRVTCLMGGRPRTDPG